MKENTVIDKKGLLTTTQFAKLIGRSVFCVKNWDSKGKLKPVFVDKMSGCRYYSPTQVKDVLEVIAPSNRGETVPFKKTSIIDARTGEEVDISGCLTILEFAEAVGKTKQTVLNWDRGDKLKPAYVDATNKARYYVQEQIKEAIETFGASKKQGNKDFIAPIGFIIDKNSGEKVDISGCVKSREFAALCGISVPALYKREAAGTLIPFAVDIRNNTRYYKKNQALN